MKKGILVILAGVLLGGCREQQARYTEEDLRLAHNEGFLNGLLTASDGKDRFKK